VNVAELIAELEKLPPELPVRSTGEVVGLEVMTYYGDQVVYLRGDQE
jgi:hypothetical protein